MERKYSAGSLDEATAGLSVASVVGEVDIVAIRKEKIAMRKNIADDDRKKFNHWICRRIIESDEYKKSDVILSYVAANGEADLKELNEVAKNAGKTVVYPYCISNTEFIALYPNDEDAWRIGKFGIMEPIPEKSKEIVADKIDFVICPCTAFDECGSRIGMGGGYYDRYLPKCTKARIVAVAFEVQKVQEIKCEIWDFAMVCVYTEKCSYLCSER